MKVKRVERSLRLEHCYGSDKAREALTKEKSKNTRFAATFESGPPSKAQCSLRKVGKVQSTLLTLMFSRTFRAKEMSSDKVKRELRH